MSSPAPDDARALPVASGEAGPAGGGEFGNLYRRTLGPLRNYLARFLRDHNEAQDVAHDAYLKTYEVMQKKELTKPQSYLFTTARRLAYNFRMRRGQRMVPTDGAMLDAQAGSAEDPSHAAATSEDRALLRAAVALLPPRCQTVLVLRLHEGLRPAEIAERMGTSESTVNNQLSKALRMVRTYLAERRNGPGLATEAGSEPAGANSILRP